MSIPIAVVSKQEWDAARETLLVKEKELTHARDAVAAERRRLPMVAVEKEYRFEGPEGAVGLLDLFAGRRQRIVPLLHGGAAPVRRFLPELIVLIWNGKNNPGRVFDLTLTLEQVADGYRAMDSCRGVTHWPN